MIKFDLLVILTIPRLHKAEVIKRAQKNDLAEPNAIHLSEQCNWLCKDESSYNLRQLFHARPLESWRAWVDLSFSFARRVKAKYKSELGLHRFHPARGSCSP